MKKIYDIINNGIMNTKNKCAVSNETAIENSISKLSEEQQQAVRSCLASAKVPNKGRRYTQQWVYECILMRIKSKKLYEHLRSHHILALPHVDTLNKYIKRMGSAYGFNDTMFKLLNVKSKELDPAERRGNLFRFLPKKDYP